MALVLDSFLSYACALHTKWVYSHSRLALPIFVHFCVLLSVDFLVAMPTQFGDLVHSQLRENVALPGLYPPGRTKISQAIPPVQMGAACAFGVIYFVLTPAMQALLKKKFYSYSGSLKEQLQL